MLAETKQDAKGNLVYSFQPKYKLHDIVAIDDGAGGCYYLKVAGYKSYVSSTNTFSVQYYLSNGSTVSPGQIKYRLQKEVEVEE